MVGAIRARGVKSQRGVHIRVRLADILCRIEQPFQLRDRKMLRDVRIRGKHLEKRLARLHGRFRRALDEMMRVEPADPVAEREHHRFAENQPMRDVEIRGQPLDVDIEIGPNWYDLRRVNGNA